MRLQIPLGPESHERSEPKPEPTPQDNEDALADAWVRAYHGG
jgi:hypothetical protein